LLILKDLHPDYFEEFKLKNGDFNDEKIIENNCKNLVIHALSIKLGINWNVVVSKNQNENYKIKGGKQPEEPDDDLNDLNFDHRQSNDQIYVKNNKYWNNKRGNFNELVVDGKQTVVVDHVDDKKLDENK
jgi:hypothetical protein